MNLNMKKVSVPVLMFLMAQSGFGVSNANFGNANLALAQNGEIGKARAVRCLTEEAIKKDIASGDGDHAELRKLIVNKDESALEATIKEIGEMLKKAYIEYLVPRSDPNDAVRGKLEGKSSVEEMVEALVDTNLFTKNSTGKYLWWTIDGYDDATGGTIKWKFDQVVEAILGGTQDSEPEYNWKDINDSTNVDENKKTDADLLMRAIIKEYDTDDSKKSIAGLTEEDFKNGGWEIPGKDDDIPEDWKWDTVLDEINKLVYPNGTHTNDPDEESIIDALQVFLGDRLMEKLIDAGKTEEEDRDGDGEIRTALENFFEGHFMRKVTGGEEQEQDISETSFENALKEVNDIMSDAAGDDNDKKERIYNVTFDAIYDRIEGLLRSKDAPVSIDMFKDGGIFSDTFKKTLVNLLDNLAPDEQGTRSWDKIEDTDLKKQLKRLVWIDDDDNDVAGAKESDNESYDYDSSDINGGDSDEEQAERAEDAVEEGFKSANDLTGN